MDGEKFKRISSEVNIRAVSRRQNELIGKFKMAAGDMVGIKGQVMEYTSLHPFLSQPPGGTFQKLSSDAIFVVCSHAFALF